VGEHGRDADGIEVLEAHAPEAMNLVVALDKATVAAAETVVQ